MEPSSTPKHSRPGIPTPGQMVTLVLILIAILMWVVIILMGMQLQERIDANFRLIMELAKSAGAS